MTSQAAHTPSSNSHRGGYHRCLYDVLGLVLLTLILTTHPAKAASGCADGSREGLYTFESTAACEGIWEGHIENAALLCAPGWRVCTPFDVHVLRNITWRHAMGVRGCMAFNAAQDGGRCQQCQQDLEQDDMAGIGMDCPHQYLGQDSCISGGRIDSSCCVDSHFHKACHFRPGLMTGVLCCRLPVKKPNIVVKPPKRMEVYRDLIFLLSCQASGMPPPRLQWYKDGRRLDRGRGRISVLSSGDLLVTLTRKSDTGMYTCEAINEEGMDMASSQVTVQEYSSGCADGSTDGFHTHRKIHACSGAWKGHVRNGKSLCAKGWRVCSPRNRKVVQELNSFEIFDLAGCYAYNAASRHNKCRKCRSGSMSGVGGACGWMSYSHFSCLRHGRMDVFKPANRSSTCEFSPGVTTGVLCCKKPRKRKNNSLCSPSCKNGGRCVQFNKCKCPQGYKGARCQIPICQPDCGPKGQCIRPNKCRCQLGYGGVTCRQKTSRCKTVCLNGARCHKGHCKCVPGFRGRSCQHAMQHVLLSRLNRTER